MQDLTSLGDSGSEISYFKLEPRNFAELTKLSDNIKKTLAKGSSEINKETNKQSDFPKLNIRMKENL